MSYQFTSPDRARSRRGKTPRLAKNVINENRQYRNTDLGRSSPATPFGYCRLWLTGHFRFLTPPTKGLGAICPDQTLLP